MKGRSQCPGFPIPFTSESRFSTFDFRDPPPPPHPNYQINLKTNFDHHIGKSREDFKHYLRKSWEDGGDSLPPGWKRRIAEGGFNFSTFELLCQEYLVRTSPLGLGKISFQHFHYDDRGYLDTVNIVIIIFKGESMMEFILSPQGVQYR